MAVTTTASAAAGAKAAGSRNGINYKPRPIELWFAKRMFTDAARLDLLRQVGALQRAGLSMDETLSKLWMSSSDNGKRPGDAYAIIINEWRRKLARGPTRISLIFEGWVPTAEMMLIDAGSNNKQMANLSDAIDRATKVTQGVIRMKTAEKSIRGPIGQLFLMLFAMLGIYSYMIIPALTKRSDPEMWTGLAMALYMVTEMVRNFALPILGLLVALGFWIMWAMPRLTGKFRLWLERKFLIFRLYRDIQGASFIVALASLKASGVPDEESIKRLKAGASPWMLERLKAVERQIMKGKNFGEALRAAGYDFPSPEIVRQMVIYASLPNFDEIMDQIGAETLESTIATVQANIDKLASRARMFIMFATIFFMAGTFQISMMMADSAGR